MREAARASQREFVMTELDTSATFCEIALSSVNSERKRRNIENALKGYRTALRFADMPERSMKKDDPQFRQSLAKLKGLLTALGQKV